MPDRARLTLDVDRRRLERRLDAVVAANRFEISVVTPLVGAALLVASALGALPAWLSFHPALVLAGTLAMRLPLVAGVLPLVDRRAGAVLAGLCGYTYAVEMVGVATGWPYGDFEYLVALGPMVAGVPLGLPVFFLPLVLNAYLLSLLLLGRAAADWRVRLPATVAVVVLVDLVLDPGAVALGFWTYADAGPYYGVPLSNYAGWVLSATVGVLALDRAFPRDALLGRLAECAFLLDDLVSFVVLWGLVNLVFGNWAPVVLTAGLAGGLLATGRFDFPVAPAFPGDAR